MGLPAQTTQITVEEYSAFEKKSQIRYEYVNGKILPESIGMHLSLDEIHRCITSPPQREGEEVF